MENQNINSGKPKRSFWWMFGYILTWLIFFAWVAIGIYGWYSWQYPNMWVMKLWIRIAIICFIFMWLLHVVIFRMKWETREKRIKRLKKIWKIIGKWGWILLLIGLVIAIINIIHGKNEYSKIPEVDESIFLRTEHQSILPDDQDALIQLNKKERERRSTPNKTGKEMDVLEVLEYAYRNFNWSSKYLIDNPYRDSKIWWERYQDECILVYSWDEASCGTWVWNKDTIDRILSSYTDKITINGEKVTVREYIEANEDQLKSDLEWLDRTASMDYYLPENALEVLPNFVQWYARGSMVALLYYIEKEDWDMVEYIVKVNYKTTDILDNLWTFISVLISLVTQWIVDDTINSSLQLLPEDVRLNLAQFYTDIMPDREEFIHNTIKWEYALWTNYRQGYVAEGNRLLTHFPIYSEKDTKRFMNYGYKLLYDEKVDKYESLFSMPESNKWNISWLEHSIYNLYGKEIILDLMPRMQSLYGRLDWNIFHKEALIENLKSGEYKVWFNEKQWNGEQADYYYWEHRLPTDEELSEWYNPNS